VHAPDMEHPDVLFPLLWGWLLDREEAAKHCLVYGAYGANAICWGCTIPTQCFSDPQRTSLEEVRAHTRRRQDMYVAIRDGKEADWKALSIHPEALAMDVLKHVPCDYSWCLADRFHHQTVIMWKLKEDTETLAANHGHLHILDKRFREQPRHRDVKPWPRGCAVVNKV